MELGDKLRLIDQLRLRLLSWSTDRERREADILAKKLKDILDD